MSDIQRNTQPARKLIEMDKKLDAAEARLCGPGGPFELEIFGDGRHFRNGPHTLVDLYNRAHRFSQSVLIIDHEGERSFEEILTLSLRRSCALRAAGLNGHRVALWMDNNLEWISWFIAITAAGACCGVISAGNDVEMAMSQLDTINCDAIISDKDFALPKKIRELSKIDLPDMGESLHAISPDAEALIVFTSGSTGAPKGVLHSHRSLMSGQRNMMLSGILASQISEYNNITPQRPVTPSTLLLSPLFYISGYSALLFALYTGGKIFVPPSEFSIKQILEIISRYRIQSLTGISDQMVTELSHEVTNSDLSSLRRIYIHGTALSANFINNVSIKLPYVQFMTGFGLTETAGSVASIPLKSSLELGGTCGRILPSVQVRIVDDDSELLSSGSVGWLEVKGDMLMERYIGSPVTESLGNSWFKTGDLAHINEGGWLYVLGRGRQAPVQSGISICDILNLEHTLISKPGIDAAALLWKHDQNIWILHIQSILPEDSVRSIISMLDGQLQLFHPLSIKLTKIMPRTSSGKIDRARL